jgi:hypothetical protein
MIDITLTVKKSDVYAEVDQTTAYAGSKGESPDNPNNYERVSTTTADHSLLDKWWTEACVIFVDKVKQFIKTYTNDSTQCSMTLSMPSTFDSALTTSINSSLKGYLVDYITAKWYSVTSTEAATKELADSSAAMIDDIMAKLYYRKRPTKRT